MGSSTNIRFEKITGQVQTNLSLLNPLYLYLDASLGIDTVNDIRMAKTTNSFVIQTCSNASTNKGGGSWITTDSKITKSLTDSNLLEAAGSYIDLESGKSGMGQVIVGNHLQYAYFAFDTSANVTLHMNSDNVLTSSSDNYLVIRNNAFTNVRIVNELGSTYVVTTNINYNS